MIIPDIGDRVITPLEKNSNIMFAANQPSGPDPVWTFPLPASEALSYVRFIYAATETGISTILSVGVGQTCVLGTGAGLATGALSGAFGFTPTGVFRLGVAGLLSG